jgi:hypothetical protein
MGQYYQLGNQMADNFRNIQINNTAVSPATAQTFETGVGQLMTNEVGNTPSVYDPSRVPVPTIMALQDTQVLLVKNSDDATSDYVNPSTGHYIFKLYLSNVVGQPSPSGNNFAHIVLTPAN